MALSRVMISSRPSCPVLRASARRRCRGARTARAAHGARDRQPLQAFLSELRLTRQRAVLATLDVADDNDDSR